MLNEVVALQLPIMSSPGSSTVNMEGDFCGTCSKRIQVSSYTMKCSTCTTRFHIRCVGLERSDKVDKTTWYCPHCSQSILPFNSFDEDEDFFIALKDLKHNDAYRLHESKIFMPFEINDIQDAFTDLDPDYQYYTDLNYNSNTNCDYYLEDDVNDKFSSMTDIHKKNSPFFI